MTYLVVWEDTPAHRVADACYTYETEEAAVEEAKRLSRNGDRYAVYKLVQTHTFAGRKNG